jgi:hypothetical protein
VLLKSVPQDDANLFEGKGSELCYAVDENGQYVTARSIGWDPKNTVINQAWEVINHKVSDTRTKVLEGTLSPISFYMEKQLMDIALLAQYVGMSRWRVRRHLRADVFRKLDRRILSKYAEAFDISVEQLCKVE